MALKPLNSVAGFSVGETPVNIILANGDVTANALNVTGKSNLNAIGNVFISGGSNGQVIQTDGLGNLSFVTIDTWQIQNGNSNVQVLANSNVTISVAGNANVATFTSTGVNVSGYFSAGNITANGNLSANNYVVTPGSTDLIIAPGGSYTRVYSNLNPYSDTTYDLGNSLARWNNVFSNTANVTGNIKAGGLLTDNLYYANGQPWDLQEAAGSNTQIQYNDNNNFGASANFTYNDSTQLLTVLGNSQFNNANLGNIAVANFVNVASNLVSSNVNVNLQLNGNTANFTGNLIANNLTINLELAGNTANFTGNITAANANLGNLATANFVNVSSNLFVTDTANVGNLRTDNLLYANGVPWDLQQPAGSNSEVQFNSNNDFGASANFTYDSTFNLGGGLLNVGFGAGGRIETDSIYANYANINGDIEATGNITGNNINITGNIETTGSGGDLILSGGDITGVNDISANSANFAANVTSNNVTVNLQLSGNTANFTGNITAANASLGNLATANFINVSSNLQVTDTASVGNLRTDNLLYANGLPWDLQEAAGSNTQIQYNDGNNNFGASANLTYNDSTQLFTVLGNAQFNNANLGNVATANFVNVSSNLVSNNVTVNLALSGNAANFSGNVIANNATVNLELAGNTANFSGNLIANNITGNGTVDAGNLKVTTNVTSNLIPNVSGTYNLGNSTSTWGNVYATNFIGNISGNLTAPGANTEIIFNDANIANAVANFTYDKTFNSGGGRLNVGNTANGQIITDSFYAAYANINGNIDTSGNINANGDIVINGAGGDITMTGGNITGVNNISANSANFAANVTSNNVTVNLQLSGNTANFSGNITSLNANLGNLASANYINVANDANITGNVYAGNLVGPLANGTSNIRIFQNANIELSVGGNANVVTVTTSGLYVVGEIQTTAGNMLSNGNVTANGFLNGANANVTGQLSAGSVLTANITAPTGNITISAAGVDQNIILNPTGNGTVDVGLHKITQVGDPTNPHDAATKEYVDNIAQGLSIHAAVEVTSTTNLNAVYADGGTALTTTTISGGKTITFSANHGLSIGDEIYWTNSFNGIISNDAYFVYSTPALNQITVKAGFYGAEVTTLTNGTGLTQAARGNPGVGATLTNNGANVAISIDSIALSATNRVLVQGQTNAWENGVYVVTTVGAPDSPGPGSKWVLTRATNEDQYDPKSTTGLGYGDYFFVQEGINNAGSSYVLTSPVGEIVFGVTNIGFSQFTASGSYTAGSGINITGTVISANVDGVTTDIVGGNIVVKASANLTTPNLGDATFSSLSWNNQSNGNVSANNLSISNVANITLDLTVGGNIQANGTISSNANVSGLNLTTNGNVQAGGNVLAGNITANSTVYTTNANVTGTTITDFLTVNNAFTANTANFSGNIIANNATINLELSGNTANFSGNVTINSALSGNTANFTGTLTGNIANFTGNLTAANANLGNLATANFFTGTLINGTSNAGIDGTNGNFNISVGGNANVLQVTSSNANITGNLNVSGNFNVSSLVADTLTANTAVYVGNTTITWNSITTTSVSANQTIASLSVTGITGLEFLVKAVDSGGKYSIATVQAVTDGTNVDYATFGTVQLGGYTGSLAVNVVGGFVRLQVTPSSSNSTVWTTQARTI